MRARVRVRECACVVQCSVVFWLTCRVWMCLSLVKSHFFCFFFFFECQCNCYDTPPQPHHPLHAGAHTRAQRCCRRTLSIHINALEERFKETANPSPLLPRLFFFSFSRRMNSSLLLITGKKKYIYIYKLNSRMSPLTF